MKLVRISDGIVHRFASIRSRFRVASPFLNLSPETRVILTVALLAAVTAFWKRPLLALSVVAIGKYILHFSQNHPHLSRILHVALNAIPDLALLSLAVAGLGYLMPELLKKFEMRRSLRVATMAAFVAIGFTGIIVNAINREEDDHAKFELNQTIINQSKKLDGVTETDAHILKYLVSNRSLNEAERRENLEKVLRNEYITSHDLIDPEILAGNKMPPEQWMNEKLRKLEEKWTFTQSADRAPMQVIQEMAPEPKHANLAISFAQPVIGVNDLATVEAAPLKDDAFDIDVEIINISDVPAKGVKVWIRPCEGCTWVGPPPGGFIPPETELPFDQRADFFDMLPNVTTPKIHFSIKPPLFPKPSGAQIGFYYACDNCPPVDWKKPQILSIGQAITRHYPEVPYIPGLKR